MSFTFRDGARTSDNNDVYVDRPLIVAPIYLTLENVKSDNGVQV